MKTVLCYGDSNTWGAVPMTRLSEVRRFGWGERWADVLRRQLGEDYWVIEEGLNGRTTVHDDPIEGTYKNGKTYLTPCLETHQPIDLVVLMLGTNDLKKRFSLSAFDIAWGVGVLVDIIRASASYGANGQAPKVLLMCPPPLAKLTLFAEMLEDGTEKSRKLGGHYRAVAEERGCAFLNTGEVIVSSEVDGIHFDLGEHGKLGAAVAEAVRGILK